MRKHGWFKESARHSLSGRGVESKRRAPRKGSLGRVPVSAGAKFKLGQVVITPGAIELLLSHNELPEVYLMRHQMGDWGDLDPEDTEMQNASLRTGHEERLMSAYHLSGMDKIWIITEWDRSVTTILLPEDY